MGPQQQRSGRRAKRPRVGSNTGHGNFHSAWNQNPSANMTGHWNNPGGAPSWGGSWGANTGGWNAANAWPTANMNPAWNSYATNAMVGSSTWGTGAAVPSTSAQTASSQSHWGTHFGASATNPASYYGNTTTQSQIHPPHSSTSSYANQAAYANYSFGYGQPSGVLVGSGQTNTKPFI
jgi:hypothetical protein